MSSPVEAPFQFVNFLVRETQILFKEPGKHKINLHFNPKGYIMKDLNQFHLELEVEIKDEQEKFSIKLVTNSIFEYPENSDIEKYKTGYFILNAPAIVFPYLRAYITGVTALSGMPPLTLPTLNMAEVGEKLKENMIELKS